MPKMADLSLAIYGSVRFEWSFLVSHKFGENQERFCKPPFFCILSRKANESMYDFTVNSLNIFRVFRFFLAKKIYLI